MTLGFGHSLRSIALAPHVTISVSRAVSSRTPRPTSVHEFLPSVLMVVGSYLIVLVIMVVFGVCMGWQRQGSGGNGGGGTPKPPAGEPTPPGGRQLAPDSTQVALTDHFSAWEGQLQSADEQPARTG